MWAGGGIWYPHPLSTFSKPIRLYLLVVNGATVVTVLSVASAASRLRTAYLKHSNMHAMMHANMMTLPLAYAAMP